MQHKRTMMKAFEYATKCKISYPFSLAAEKDARIRLSIGSLYYKDGSPIPLKEGDALMHDLIACVNDTLGEEGKLEITSSQYNRMLLCWNKADTLKITRVIRQKFRPFG